jgi:hypothetical protein
MGEAAMTRLTTKLITTTALLLALGATGPRAQEPVHIAASPAIAFEPALLRIRVRVEPNAANRALAIAAESDGYYRSSMFELEGDRAPQTFFVEFKGVPAGAYQLSAVVMTANGKGVGVATQGVRILSVEGQ